MVDIAGSSRSLAALGMTRNWCHPERSEGSMLRLNLQLRHVDPAALLPALMRALDELHALGALDQGVREGRVLDDVADEHLPLGLEAVLVRDIVRHLLPSVVKVDGLLLVGVPHRPRRG